MGTGRSRSRGRIKDLPGYSYDDVDHDTMLDMARGRGYRDVSVSLVSALGEMGVGGFCKVAGPQDIRWQAVFMVGPAGAGKTWYRDRRYLKHVRFKLIDPDEIKKAQPLSSTVFTPVGPRKMGEIRMGDAVCRPDGEITTVVGVYPQGVQTVYDVEFSSGVRTRCTADHLWKVYWRGGKKKDIRDMSDVMKIKDIVKNYKQGKRKVSKYWIPSAGEVYFENQEVSIDPYIMGLCLGDGHIDRSISISMGEDDLKETVPLVKKLVGSDHKVVYDISKQRMFIRASTGRQTKKCKKGYVYKRKDRELWIAHGKHPGVRETVYLGNYPCEKDAQRALDGFVPEDNRQRMLWHYFEELGLRYSRSWNKFVPDSYLYNSLEVRLGVIQGLLDTDGCCSGNGLVSYWSCSERLANDFAFLVRSIGGKCSVSRRQKGDGERDGFNVQVFYDGPRDLFRLARKQNRIRNRANRVRDFIVDIREDGTEECQCIRVESDDGLYLTDDFIVTHNTHPDYDPEQPYKVHDWSKEVSDGQYKGIVESGRGDPVVVDGTGRDASGIARKMQLARRNGYRIFLIYIWVPLEVSIWRNRNRARFVPEAKVVSAYGDIEKSFMKLKGMTDKFRVVPNFSSSDLRQAQDDAKVYPYPQVSRPPRPGDGNYGLDMADRAASEGVVMTKRVARELGLAFEDIKVAQHLQNVKTLELLTERELTRALRDATIAEQEAVKQYETIVDSTDNERVKAVLQDIANEERVHVGELQALLNDLLDDEADLVEEGMEEVEEIMES